MGDKSSHQKGVEITPRGEWGGLEMSQASRAFQCLCLKETQTLCTGDTRAPVPLASLSAFQTISRPAAV